MLDIIKCNSVPRTRDHSSPTPRCAMNVCAAFRRDAAKYTAAHVTWTLAFKHYGYESRTIAKSIRTNPCHASSYCHICKTAARRECGRPYEADAIGNDDILKTIAFRECVVLDGVHASWNHYVGQSAAATKRRIADNGNTPADFNVQQSIAIAKCICTNVHHTAANPHISQCATIAKRLIINTRHAIWNRYARQPRTIGEYACRNCCNRISVNLCGDDNITCRRRISRYSRLAVLDIIKPYVRLKRPLRIQRHVTCDRHSIPPNGSTMTPTAEIIIRTSHFRSHKRHAVFKNHIRPSDTAVRVERNDVSVYLPLSCVSHIAWRNRCRHIRCPPRESIACSRHRRRDNR